MVDRNNTAREWALARTDLLFLPVGAFEQHGPHLPLDTDCRCAEYFARVLAEHFNGAVLPVQSIASSLEHTGWRGSFSLRPETLISLVRDIAEDAESQNYKFLVIVNCHGGNFPLGPASRDWNRRDRKLKILLVDPFFYSYLHKRADRFDIHAGENETSILMHICGKEFPLPENTVTGNITALRQKDLNTFGVGYLNPNGLPGYPEDASAEKGRTLVKYMTEGIIQEVEERLQLLRKNPRYCGAGGLYQRQCIADEIPELTALSTSVNWDHIEADWKMFLDCGKIWSMVSLNRIVGSAAWIPRSRNSVWIGLVITRQDWRGCSIATTLMKRVLDDSSKYAARYLDAAPGGIPIYRKLGFVDMYKVFRMTSQGIAEPAAAPARLTWRSAGENEFPLPGMDPDDSLLPAMFRRNPDYSGVGCDGDRITAWFTGRKGRQFNHIGAVWAENPEDAAEAVRQYMLKQSGPYLIDVPEYQRDFIAFLNTLGFRSVREFLRMRLGPDQAEVSDPHLFAAAGPEFG